MFAINPLTNEMYDVLYTGLGAHMQQNTRLCWQAHDEYYSCIDEIQNKDKAINKYKCMNQLYAYESYCHPHFIKSRQLYHALELRDRNLWTQDQIDLINFNRSKMHTGK